MVPGRACSRLSDKKSLTNWEAMKWRGVVTGLAFVSEFEANKSVAEKKLGCHCHSHWGNDNLQVLRSGWQALQKIGTWYFRLNEPLF